MQQRIDIKTFAQKLGVSTATISRAFGANGRISDATRKKVLEAAEKMGYYANFNASNLGSKKSGSVYFFYPEIYTDEPDYFVSEIVLGINRELSHTRVFKVTPFDEKDNRILSSCKQQIMDGRVAAAIILGGTKSANVLAELAERVKIPYVIIGKSSKFTKNVVDYDNEHGAFLAGKYFKETKRKRVAYISGHLDKAKQSGFAKGLGINASELLVIEGGAGFKYGMQAMEEIHKHHPDVDGVLCGNDTLAIGVINAAKKLNISIPKDLAVIGFDDIAIAKHFSPALSTVSLHLKQIGTAAVNLLEKQFATHQKVANESIQCDLIIREST